MKIKFQLLLGMLAFLMGISQTAAQKMRFFRIFGPTITTITAFRPDGTLVWSNAQQGGIYTIQTTSCLVGESNWVDYVTIPAASSVNTNLLIDFSPPAGMTLIPAGAFAMGDTINDVSSGDDNSPTNVTVSAFYMDVCLISYSQWQSVFNWATNHGYSFDLAGSGKAPNHPVQTVNWYDSVKWCNARSQQTGLTPVYYTDAGLTQVYTNGDTDAVYPNWAAKGFRLPTEAEWEKAARGGLSGQRFPWGNTISESLANYLSSTNLYSWDLGPNGLNPVFAIGDIPYTNPVGYFAPNGYGLHDMAGNVDEWCWDWYQPQYAGGTDPHGPTSVQVPFRVIRGGNCQLLVYFATCFARDRLFPDYSKIFVGFRCVRGL